MPWADLKVPGSLRLHQDSLRPWAWGSGSIGSGRSFYRLPRGGASSLVLIGMTSAGMLGVPVLQGAEAVWIRTGSMAVGRLRGRRGRGWVADQEYVLIGSFVSVFTTEQIKNMVIYACLINNIETEL